MASRSWSLVIIGKILGLCHRTRAKRRDEGSRPWRDHAASAQIPRFARDDSDAPRARGQGFIVVAAQAAVRRAAPPRHETASFPSTLHPLAKAAAVSSPLGCRDPARKTSTDRSKRPRKSRDMIRIASANVRGENTQASSTPSSVRMSGPR